MENSALATVTASPLAPHQQSSLVDFAMTTQEVLRQAALIQQVMNAVMKDKEHYGVIPGTSGKKSLLKPGAEKLCFVFGLSNKLEITADNLPGGHREYRIVCNLFDRAGNLRGQGVGSASTMESKHRYRGAIGKPCPKCGESTIKRGKVEYGGGWYCDKKSGGCGATFKPATAEAKALDALPTTRAENADPADQYNTVLKMAKKRALVDAVLTATAASDIFAQDLEDLEDKIEDEPPVATPQPVASAGKPEETPEDANVVKEPPKAKKNGNGNGTQHPAFQVGKELFNALPSESRLKVIERLCGLFGKKKTTELPAEALEEFGTKAGQLLKLLQEHGLQALMDNLEGMEANVALAQQEGAK